MSAISVPLDTIVPISNFSKGSSAKEFAKVANGVPVTVLKNSEPTYFIINAHDYREFRNMERRLENYEARLEALEGKGKTFNSVDELMDDLNA